MVNLKDADPEQIKTYIKTLTYVEGGDRIHGGLGTYSLKTDIFTDGTTAEFIQLTSERSTKPTLKEDQEFPYDDAVEVSAIRVTLEDGIWVEDGEKLFSVEQRYNKPRLA